MKQYIIKDSKCRYFRIDSPLTKEQIIKKKVTEIKRIWKVFD